MWRSNATNVVIKNFKAFSNNKYGDGIDVFGGKNITINYIFYLTHDDCIAIYGARANAGKVWYGDIQNVSVTNSILMPDLARPVNMGTHGFPWAPGGGHTIENLNFSNLDIWLHNQAHRIQFISADGNLIQNVKFEDIRVDDHVGNSLFTMSVKSWDYAVGRGINNVHFKNVSYIGSGNALLEGYDSNRRIQNITLENVTKDGSAVTNANIFANSYVNNVNIIAPGDPVPEVAPQFPSPAPINLALNRTASASSSQSNNPISSGNDSSTSTRWSAVDGNANGTLNRYQANFIVSVLKIKWLAENICTQLRRMKQNGTQDLRILHGLGI
ncbi:glycosyl hydrolase family 28 protein [Paenibacillus prosopidis]|uniref:Glycosyl hydrolase family 28 n=1 Tax=Paenibacillus prosopidis TaxID=630520 RepID=A0A368VZT6_9BACL|nr:glycosyl hydrolase family 28 protein [Paenibacillus prosopidis]RCW46409.1 glycosyl hydrolase family 28 [Paenibacillus prosopidis]